MKRILGLVSLQIIVVLCALIVFYAYRMSKDLDAIGAIAAQRQAASDTQAAVKQVAFELQAMETSQRGYLVTGDASYLKAYGEANSGLAARFNDLRSRLSGPDRQVETQLESVAAAKIAFVCDSRAERLADVAGRFALPTTPNVATVLGRSDIDGMEAHLAELILEQHRGDRIVFDDQGVHWGELLFG